MTAKKITSLLFLLAISVSLSAQKQGRDMAVEHKIEKQLEAVDPAMLATFKAATIAMDENNYRLSDSLFSIVCQKDSAFDPAIRRSGSMKVLLGKADEGLALCEKALAINKSSDNILTFASSVLGSANGGSIPTERLDKALDLLHQGQSLPGGESYEYPALIGQIALQLNDETLFAATTEELLRNILTKWFLITTQP